MQMRFEYRIHTPPTADAFDAIANALPHTTLGRRGKRCSIRSDTRCRESVHRGVSARATESIGHAGPAESPRRLRPRKMRASGEIFSLYRCSR